MLADLVAGGQDEQMRSSPRLPQRASQPERKGTSNVPRSFLEGTLSTYRSRPHWACNNRHQDAIRPIKTDNGMHTKCTPPALPAPQEAPHRRASGRHGYACNRLGSGGSGLPGGVLLPGRGVVARHPHRQRAPDPQALDRSPLWGEEITLLEEELLPAMAGFLERMEAIDRAIEADQELEVAAHQAS